MNKLLIINLLKKNKAVLEHKFNILKIGLFGSYSTDTFNDKSDIDLVYELKEGKSIGLKEVYEMETFFQKPL